MEPVVAIVGRPNVGKSALFNALVGRDVSLVFDRPGTTRDRLIATARWNGRKLTLIDTGGIGVDDAAGFQDEIAHEVDLALAAATQIIFVVDAREGLTPLDQAVARQLRKSKAPVFVAANKIDSDKQENLDAEFSRLGFAGVFAVSAAHRRGLEDLRDAVSKGWPKQEEEVRSEVKAGASDTAGDRGSAECGEVVADQRAGERAPRDCERCAGTTRDAVDIAYTWRGTSYLFIDTAGMRQERRVSDELERAMTGRTAHSINRADVCILVVDASTGVSMQDKKIAGLIQEAHAPCIIAVNKWDIARDQGDASKTREREYFDQVRQDLFFPFLRAGAFPERKDERTDRWVAQDRRDDREEPALPFPDRAAQSRDQDGDGKVRAAGRARAPVQGALRLATGGEGGSARDSHAATFRQQRVAADSGLRALPGPATAREIRPARLPAQVCPARARATGSGNAGGEAEADGHAEDRPRKPTGAEAGDSVHGRSDV